MFKYVGRTVEILYDTGYHFKVEYLSDTKLRWTSLKARTDGAPMTGEETYYYHQQTEHIFTLSWIEATGITVSQNLDFDKMVVYAFMTWNASNKRGGRDFLAHQGTFKFLS